MYSCGPTVYDFAHIGNFRAYVCVDILKRYLKYKGYRVTHIMNLTDVDDKTIRRSQEQKMSLREFTEKYSRYFFEDITALAIDKADVYPKATEHIAEMVALIKKLLAKGIAYTGEDGSAYYSILKFKAYGKLSHEPLHGLKAGARVSHDEYDKASAHDFALWKAYTPDDGDVFWETEIGKGRPGWHIECSAMATKHLGESFDIHAGGIDLIFPHHENEIAQSEGASGTAFAAYWFHNEHLLVNGKKMSKSLGNFFTLRDLLANGASARAIRYLLASVHYRVQLNFTAEAIDGAENTIKRLDEWTLKLDEIRRKNAIGPSAEITAKIKDNQRAFEAAMDDDLGISGALANLFDFMREINAAIDGGKISGGDAQKILEYLKKIDGVLGVFKFDFVHELESELQKLIEEREAARKEKNFAAADALRRKLLEKGIVLDDTKDGVRWKRV